MCRQTALGVIGLGSMASFFRISDWQAGADGSNEAHGRAGLNARHAALASGRIASVLAALLCVPLALIGLDVSSTSVGLGFMAALLPSVVALAFLKQTDAETAILCAASVLATVSACAYLSGAGSIGLAFLSLAAGAEAMVFIPPRARTKVVVLLAVPLVLGALSSINGTASAIDSTHAIEWLCALVGFVHGGCTLASAAQLLSAADAAIETARSRHAAMLLPLRETVLTIDRQGRVLEMGDNAATALGLAPAELAGRGMIDRIHVGDKPAVLKAASDAAMDKTAATVKARMRGAADGGMVSYYFVECRFIPMAGSDCLTLVIRDITASEQEMEMHRAVDSLRKAAMRSRGLFISGLSHEVRTPLNAVIGFSEMLSNPDIGPLPNETVREYAGIIHDSGHQLFRLVTATIDLFRLDSGTYEINHEPFGVTGVIEGCVEDIAAEAQAKNVAILRDVPPFLGDVVSDRRAIKQALGHVLANAVKFSGAGSNVVISARSRGEGVVITVVDRGPGIAPAHLSRIGDPFFQGDGAYDRAAGGAGLGLALVKRLMDVLGGDLEISSVLGAGTSVKLFVPHDIGAQEDAEDDSLARLAPAALAGISQDRPPIETEPMTSSPMISRRKVA